MIATSIEQSYDLLAAGLSPESADMHYTSRKMERNESGEWKMVLGDLCIGKPESENDLPAWSCTMLIEIAVCPMIPYYKAENIINYLVDYIIYRMGSDYPLKKYFEK